MPFLRVTLALLLAGCLATPDLVYAPDDAGADTSSANASDAANTAPDGHADGPTPKQCLKKDQRCASGGDCCSGRCSLKDEGVSCD
jgi:hypothetical protein